MQFRERCGEKLTKDSPLFRQQFDRNDSLDVTHPKPLLRDGVITALDDALLRSGLKIAAHLTEDNCFPGKERKEVGMTKGFRKFAITQMAKSRMDAEIREKLVGHTIGIATHYIRYSPEEMLQEYIKAVDLLTLNEENRLRRQINELAARSDRFADLEGQIKDQEERHKKEMQEFAKEAVVNTINQMLHNRQIPLPFIIDNGGLYKPNDPTMPSVAAAGKEQCNKFSIEQLKSMTLQERKEREQLLKKNKAYDLLAEQQNFEKSLV